MRHAAPVLRRRGELQAQQLLLGEYVPQAEIHSKTAALHRNLAVHQGLGVDGLPVSETRLDGRRQVLLDEAGGIQRPEQAGPLKIGADHLGNIGALLSAEGGDRHGQGLDVGAVHIQLDLGPRRRAQPQRGDGAEQGEH